MAKFLNMAQRASPGDLVIGIIGLYRVKIQPEIQMSMTLFLSQEQNDGI